MDIQSKLLDPQYIETRLREFPEIRNKSVKFELKKSDRAMSKTIYVEFFTLNGGKWYKQQTVRISDHSLPNSPHQEFIVSPYDFLSKKKKDQFMKALHRAIKSSEKRSFYKQLDKLSSGVQGEE